MDYLEHDNQTYAIVSNYHGYSNVTLAIGMKIAIREFLQTARLITDILPNDLEVTYLGQDEDDSLPLLSIVVPELQLNIVSLQTVTSVDNKSVESGNLVEAPLGDIKGIDDCHSFSSMAMNLKKLSDSKDEAVKAERRQNAAKSWPALHMSRNYIEMLIQMAETSLHERGEYNAPLDLEALQDAIDKIKLMHSATATIK